MCVANVSAEQKMQREQEEDWEPINQVLPWVQTFEESEKQRLRDADFQLFIQDRNMSKIIGKAAVSHFRTRALGIESVDCVQDIMESIAHDIFAGAPTYDCEGGEMFPAWCVLIGTPAIAKRIFWGDVYDVVYESLS